MSKTKVTLVKYLGSIDPIDIQEKPLPLKGVSPSDLMFFMDEGKLHIYVVATGTIEEPEEVKQEGEEHGGD